MNLRSLECLYVFVMSVSMFFLSLTNATAVFVAVSWVSCYSPIGGFYHRFLKQNLWHYQNFVRCLILFNQSNSNVRPKIRDLCYSMLLKLFWHFLINIISGVTVTDSNSVCLIAEASLANRFKIAWISWPHKIFASGLTWLAHGVKELSEQTAVFSL